MKLHRDLVEIIRLPDVSDFLTSQGNEIAATTPERFSAYIGTELAKWSKVIKEAGLRPE
jgi:tripartite-type tricarboxylate transporter receptor subunit TctC